MPIENRIGGALPTLVRTLVGTLSTNSSGTIATKTATISATAIPNYSNLTVDNFSAIPTTNSRATGQAGDLVSGSVSLSYNNVTGILTLTYLYPRGGGVAWVINYNVYAYTVK